MKTIVLLPDIHYPHQDERTIKAVLKFIKWFKPDVVNLMGDAMNMDAVNHWKKEKGSNKYFEGKRLLKEYKGFDKEILTPIEKIIPKNCQKVYMGGNHEDWVNQVIEKEPQLEGLIEIPVALHLKEREWEWIPYEIEDKNGNIKRGMVQYGKLIVLHGQYINKYNTAKTAEVFSKSCVYGHTHTFQVFTKTSFNDNKDYHTATSLGCLANKSPDYMNGRPNSWVNSFGILYVREDNNYNLYIPVIVEGQFVFAGKLFKG